jgi:hypothetical protein
VNFIGRTILQSINIFLLPFLLSVQNALLITEQGIYLFENENNENNWIPIKCNNIHENFDNFFDLSLEKRLSFLSVFPFGAHSATAAFTTTTLYVVDYNVLKVSKNNFKGH